MACNKEYCFTFVADIYISIIQILSYMRTSVKVNNRAVVAVAHGEFPFAVNSANIMSALRVSKMGKTDEVKDFLPAGDSNCYIARSTNSARHRCLVIYLDCLPDETTEKIKAGM